MLENAIQVHPKCSEARSKEKAPTVHFLNLMISKSVPFLSTIHDF